MNLHITTIPDNKKERILILTSILKIKYIKTQSSQHIVLNILFGHLLKIKEI